MMEGLIEQFHLLMDRSRSTAQYAHLRSTINSEKEANKFVELFAEKTNTNWTPQKQYSLKYVFYCTWFCNPFWRKKVHTEGEDNNPFFRKREISQGSDCFAKINIYIKKPDASSTMHDEYLYYDPPLPCVIEIAGQHNHRLDHPEEKAMKEFDDRLRIFIQDDSAKREFFKYFQMGLSASDAKKKFTMQYRQKKSPKKPPIPIPTLRQTEIFFKEWQDVKDNFSTSLKEDNCREFNQNFVSFKEFLEAIPKREIIYSVKHLESKTDILAKSVKNQQNKDIKFPLVFVLVGSAAGIPSSVNESHISDEAMPKYVLDIPIKLEPLNDGYEDVPTQRTTEMMEDTSILPTPTQFFSCGDNTTTEEIDIKPNICIGDNTTTEEIDIKPNIWKAGNSFLPLMFTLKGSVFEKSNSKSLVYDLKQGSAGVQATEAVMPQISAVQINSMNEVAFQFKDASMLTVEAPLNITIQTELLEVNANSKDCVNERVDNEDVPAIINVSSNDDLSPVITDYQIYIQNDQESGNVAKKPVLTRRINKRLYLKQRKFNMGLFITFIM
ncbi:hypothetical protein HNY73_002783 [Argiope bruennichi]|uniref:Uncharacterized protein n=1 Tax=Argiope bruennichi TaxID=94029 RepID=A0A8T0FUU8_ARGBR|nr:hypothetical protein HNY73_002783 [Argiope bruennichi]